MIDPDNLRRLEGVPFDGDDLDHGITPAVIGKILLAVALLVIVGVIAAALWPAVEQATEIREYW